MKACFCLNLCELSSLWTGERLSHLMDRFHLKAAERISFGSSFCEVQFLSVNDSVIRFFNELHDALQISFSLTIPAARQRYIEDVLKKTDDVVANLRGLDELVVNDLSMLHLLGNKYPGIHIIAGRRLCSFEHDVRMDDHMAQARHALSIIEELFPEADGIEIDFPVPDVLEKELCRSSLHRRLKPLYLRLHSPAVMLSCTYYCQYAAGQHMHVLMYSDYSCCTRQCQKYCAVYSGDIIKFGRAVYHLNREPDEKDSLFMRVYFPIMEYLEMMQ